MDLNLLIHTLASITALITGGMIFFNNKGTGLHRKIGYIYASSMVIVLVTSFFIFQLFDGFGVYHACSIVSGITLMIGLYFPLFKRSFPKWVEHHMVWMSYSYIGLVMAGGSHLFPIFPEWPVSLRMFLFWGLPYILGTFFVFRNKKQIILKAIKNINT